MTAAETIHCTMLPNGITVLTEEMPDVESVALGIWADAGSADEQVNELGVAHFLEHMFFKGTHTLSAFDIAVATEDLGGSVDAYTERELTHVGARVLAEQLPDAVGLLSDMICHSTFPAEEFERERQVIIEEIRKYEGVPEERIHDLIMEALWHEGALGHPILGTDDSVRRLTHDDLIACWQRHFTPERMLVTAAGKLEHAAFVDLIAEQLTDLPGGPAAPMTLPVGTHQPYAVIDEDAEQINFCWGTRSYPAADDRVFALALSDLVLGASSTSRLFQEVREKRGLAYDIGSYLMGFRHTGLLCANGATSPELFEQVITLTREVITTLRSQGMTAKEWARGKTQMKTGLALGLEGTADRMRRLATHQLTWKEVYPLSYLMARVEAVTIEEVNAVMDEMYDLSRWAFTAIGPVSEETVRDLLEG